jgi:hypothetical protein
VTTETEVFALFEEGNPVPDLDGLGSDALDAAAHLATPETRSSEVTQLDTKPTEQKGDKRSPMMWLVAAAAVIVIGVALSLTGSADILRRHTQRGNNMTQNNPLL